MRKSDELSRTDEAAEMLDEYDFSKGVRGKYARRYAEGSNVVVLTPEVAAAFPNSAAVNEALRVLIAISREAVKGHHGGDGLTVAAPDQPATGGSAGGERLSGQAGG